MSLDLPELARNDIIASLRLNFASNVRMSTSGLLPLAINKIVTVTLYQMENPKVLCYLDNCSPACLYHSSRLSHRGKVDQPIYYERFSIYHTRQITE